MFANLKNKIREETGSDLSQLAPKLSGVQQRVAAGFREMRNRGSTSSLSALEEEAVGSPEDRTDGMKMAAASLKNRSRDMDWQQHAETLSCEKAVLEEEKAQLVRRNLELSEALAEAESYKKKAVQYQEDLDQLEGFQTQEMAKIKHLLLEREQQLTENNATISKLQADVTRLRSCQEELSNVQMEASNAEANGAQQERLEAELRLQKQVEALESEKNTLREKCARLDVIESERNSLLDKCTKLEANQRNVQEEVKIKETIVTLQAKLLVLEEKLSNVQSYKDDKEKEAQRQKEQAEELSAERDTLLLRNASLSQQGELACRELQEELLDLKATLEQQKQESTQQLLDLRSQLEQTKQADLSSTVSNLEEQLADKNKSVKVLQQRLADMKKTLQRELKCPSQNTDGSTSTNSGSNVTADYFNVLDGTMPAGTSNSRPLDDVNHTYLKHVLIKFLTSREYEAKHLTRAVATLLHFTAEEERLLRETLEWKMSWFGTKPNLGNGQTAKTIPPS